MKTKSNLSFMVIFVLAFITSKSLAVPNAVHDQKSAVIADAALIAMGGRENYNNTRYLSWLFFGKRFHVWDKYTGNIRIEYDGNNLLLMNINTRKGRVWENGSEITDEAALAEKMQWGYETWINDSYWVVMPYKLHDRGVKLSYAREGKTENGRAADIVTMTFDNVGVTPNNKYEVYFDKESQLIIGFAYFAKSTDLTPRFNLPWANWKKFGNIMLSDNRGKTGMGPLAVFETLPSSIFTEYTPALDNHGLALPGATFAK